MTDGRPVAIDLFAGAGGMALGFEQAGFDVVAALEMDASHAAVHNFNFPRCELLRRDATKLSGRELIAAARRGIAAHGAQVPSRGPLRVDVVFGGPPCQGFSVGGLLDPGDPRNRLVAEFARLVGEIKPRAFVLENVPAMASRVLPGEESVVPQWLSEQLGELGYRVAAPVVLNASRFGVPQDRRRLVVVGVRKRFDLPQAPVPRTAAWPKDPQRQPRYWEVGHPNAVSLPAGPTVADALGDLLDLDDFHDLRVSDSVALTREQVEAIDGATSPYAAILRGLAHELDDFSHPREWDPALLTSSLRTIHSDDVVERFDRTVEGDREEISRFMRLHRDGVSSTLRAGSTPDRGSFSAPRPIHYRLPRVISVREAARLHGFPDWFRFNAAKWHGFRQVGNSVCPPLARAVAASLRDALELPTIRPADPIMLGDERLLRVASGAGRAPRPRELAAAA